MTYRIRITGFKEKLTPAILSRILRFPDENKCYINRFQDQIGYLVLLRSLKYAQRLMVKWHNREINGQLLQCQLELNQIKPVFRTSAGSTFQLNKEETKHQTHGRSRSCERIDKNTKTSRDSSNSGDDKDSEITVLGECDTDDNSRLFAHQRDQLLKQKISDDKHKASSSQNLGSSVHPKRKSTC
jgi:hypothetical protein